MNTGTIDMALQLLIAALANSQQISALIQRARAEGREEFTEAEWAQILGSNDAARQRLVDAVEAARQRLAEALAAG